MGKQRNDLLAWFKSFPVQPYIVFYTKIAEGIKVVRVLHQARDKVGRLMDYYQARDFCINDLKLPELRGTVRDIKQAEVIRAEKFKEILKEKEIPCFEANWEFFMSELENRDLDDNSLQSLKQSNVAQFWIENSDLNFWELLSWVQ